MTVLRARALNAQSQPVQGRTATLEPYTGSRYSTGKQLSATSGSDGWMSWTLPAPTRRPGPAGLLWVIRGLETSPVVARTQPTDGTVTLDTQRVGTLAADGSLVVPPVPTVDTAAQAAAAAQAAVSTVTTGAPASLDTFAEVATALGLKADAAALAALLANAPAALDTFKEVSDVLNGRLSDAALRAAYVSRVALRAARHLVQPMPALPVMTSPPAIGASAASTTLTSPVTVLWSDPRIAFSGGVLVGRNANSYGRNASNKDPNYQDMPSRFEIMIEGQKFSVVTGGTGPTGGFRLLINGQYVSTAVTAATENDGASHYHDVDLGSRQTVRLTVELTATSFRGFAVEPTASVWAPPPRRTRALFLGDSITAGTAATSGLLAWPTRCAARLGWGEPWIDGQGGSGYLAVPGGGSKYADRMTFDYQYKPDVIVIFGGVNDRPTNNAAFTAAALQAAVTSLLTDIAANAQPGINSGVKPVVYVLGCWQPSGSPAADMTAANAAIQAAVTAAGTGAVFIDPAGWVTGTGRVGATTGTGNADFAISADGLHPTDEGHDMIAARVAGAIVNSLPAVIG